MMVSDNLPVRVEHFYVSTMKALYRCGASLTGRWSESQGTVLQRCCLLLSGNKAIIPIPLDIAMYPNIPSLLTV